MTLFLTVVLDLFSRQVVDWSMKSHMTTDNELARCLENPGRFTHLTNAHEVVIDKYNYDQPFMEGFSYFDSVLDISPESHAADEIRRLAAELVDYRL